MPCRRLLYGTILYHGLASTTGSAVNPTNRFALLLQLSACLIIWPGNSFAYRPFDSTDAAVAGVGELEIALGPVGFRRPDAERTVIAPRFSISYGFAKNWELSLGGQGEHPLSPAEDTRSRLINNSLALKGVLQEGALQNKMGPSVATEIGILLPGINEEHGVGASWLGIVSQRWSWGTFHFNVGSALTREHRADLLVGTVIEGPYDWKVRPVAEFVYEREFSTEEKFSVLGGAIWRVRDNLSFDIGLRQAWINRRPEMELRAGLTFAFSMQQEAMRRSSQLLGR